MSINGIGPDQILQWVAEARQGRPDNIIGYLEHIQRTLQHLAERWESVDQYDLGITCRCIGALSSVLTAAYILGPDQ